MVKHGLYLHSKQDASEERRETIRQPWENRHLKKEFQPRIGDGVDGVS